MQFISIPELVKNLIDAQMANAPVYMGGSLIVLIIMYVFRKFFFASGRRLVDVCWFVGPDGLFDDRSRVRRDRHQAG